MSKPRIVASSTKRYSDSPLAQIIAAAIATIEELKLKYPLAPKVKKNRIDPERVDSLELIYSHEKIDVAKDFLEKLNALLKQFDNYKKTSVGISMLQDVEAIQKLQLKLNTQKAVLFEAIKHELSGVIKQAKKELQKEIKKDSSINPNQRLKECIHDQLNKRKNDFSKQALGIPGKELDVLFNDITAVILERDYSGIEETDLGCDLIKIAVADGQASPTFESIGDGFKGQYGVILYGDTLFYADRINHLVKKIVAPLGEEPSLKSLNELMSTIGVGGGRSATSKELKLITSLTGSTRDLADVLNRVDEQLFKIDEHYTFSIVHPMIYEFALFMVELMEQRPSKLEQLLPFFNPQALNQDLNSGATGWAVSKALLGYSYLSKLDETTAPTDFQCELITYYNGRDVNHTTINGALFYQDYFTNFFNLLTSQLPQYVRDSLNSAAVNSEQARVRLLQQLVANETEALQRLIYRQQNEPNASKQEGMLKIKAEVSDLTTQDALLKENVQLDQRVNAINVLQQQLTELAASYETLTVNALVEKYAVLKAQLAADTTNRFDVAYANEPLPDIVLVVGSESAPNAVTIGPIKKAILKCVAHGQAILQERLDSIAVRRTWITYAMHQLEEQANEDKALSTELDVIEYNQETTLETISSPPHSSAQSITVLIEKASAWSELLAQERQQSHSKIMETQQQLSVVFQATQAELSIDNQSLRADIEKAIVQLRQDAFAIYSRHSDSAEEAPGSHYEFIQFLNAHHQNIRLKHHSMVSVHTASINRVSEELKAYLQIQEILTRSKKSIIPFKEIHQHPFLNNVPNSQNTGFPLLLVLLGAEKDIGPWEVYRQSQEQSSYLSFLPANPFRKEFEDPEFPCWLSKLTELLDLKIRSLQVTLQQESEPGESFVKLAYDIERLPEITREFDRNHQLLSQLTEYDNALNCQKKHEELGEILRELIKVSQEVNLVRDRIGQFEQKMNESIDQLYEVNELIKQVKQQYLMIESLALKLQMYTQDFLQLQQDIQIVLDAQTVELQPILDLGRTLLQNYNAKLNQQLLAVTFNEQQATAAANQLKLAEINALLAKQELVESLAQLLQDKNDEPAFFAQKKTETVWKESTNTQLSQRIQARMVAVLALYALLDEELEHCLPKEELKNQFIETFKLKLEPYEKSGDSEDILAYLKSTVQQFEGQDFQAMLYKSLSTLMDLDCEIPANYSLPPEEVISHDADCQVLQGAPTKYSDSIYGLYQQIRHITNYGQRLVKDYNQDGLAVQRLAKNLEHDVDRFVIKNKNASNDQKTVNFHQFKEHFTYRMHSEDNVMRLHSNFWTPLFVNLLLGVLTAGTALGVKLIYSLIVERRASPLFFDRTEGQQSIASMNNTVDDLDPKMSMTTLV